MIFKHNLGDEVRDLVTGYSGIIIARSEYLNGCIRYGVQRTKLTKESKPQDSEWFDEKQIEVIKAKKVDVEIKRTGGPADAPKMSANPR